MSIDHTSSYDKLDNLYNQKKIIYDILKLPKDDIEISLIQLNSKSIQLEDEIKKLKNIHEHTIAEKYILDNSSEYLTDLNKLSSLTTTFNKRTHNYYTKNTISEDIKKKELDNISDSLLVQLDLTIERAVNYNKTKFSIHKNISFLAFIIALLASFWYIRKLNSIYTDLLFLYSVDQGGYTTFTQEADLITLKMKKKSILSDNIAMIDPVTGINNLKGLAASYAEKKGMRDNSYTSVTVFEIDNFSKNNKAYPQELIQGILKKIAFTLSLHEQVTDVIARTDYNQFTIILSRQTKEQSFNDIDIIRQNILELNFNSATNRDIKITISGGHIIKPNNVNLEEAIGQARDLMFYAQRAGGNRISQIKDIAHDEL